MASSSTSGPLRAGHGQLAVENEKGTPSTPMARAQVLLGERDEGYACSDTEDYRIGFNAFLAKRKPKFRSK